jgi:hypothetical protein
VSSGGTLVPAMLRLAVSLLRLCPRPSAASIVPLEPDRGRKQSGQSAPASRHTGDAGASCRGLVAEES